MKFAASFVSLALLSSLVVAAPTKRNNAAANRNAASKGKSKAGNGKANSSGNGKNNQGNQAGNNAASASVGAVYFITNDDTNNFVIASDIGADGKLTSASAISTQGRGLHGNAAGPDGLFSQGSVKVLGNNLFTVNTGSNTVAMFAIDPNAPTQLQMVGNPVSSQGEFPVSIAVSSTSGNICVLNGGQLNSVACFKPDAKGLLPIANSFREIGITQTTAPAGPAGTVSHVLFNSDGTKLVASVKGAPPNPGFLAVWDVAADGSLSENFQAITPPTGGLLPFGMSNFPANKAALIVTDAGIGFDVIDVDEALGAAAAAANGTTTAITSLAQTNVVAAGRSTANAVDGQVAVCWTAFSSKTGNFYMTDIGTNTVTEVNVNSATLAPTIVKQYPLGTGIATIDDDVATIGNKDFLYVLAANQTSVEVLSLDAPGAAKTVQSFRLAAGNQNGINISPDNLQGMATFVKQ